MDNLLNDGNFDAIIVGAGPGGAATAKALTQKGFNAVILEKRRLPRHKCCSGLLFGESQVLLKEYFGGLPPEELYCKPKIINASNVVGYEEGRGFYEWYWEWPKKKISFPRDYLNIWRDKFDFWLARQSGAEILNPCAFKGFSLERDMVIVKANKGKESIKLRGKYLIGADGASSKIRDILDPDFKKTYMEVLVYQVYYRYQPMGLLQDHFYVFKNFSPHALLGGLHKKDDLLAIPVVVPKGVNPRPCMEDLKNFLRKKFNLKVGKPVRQESTFMNSISFTSKFCQGRERVLLVGDAAGLIHMNGSGIDTALDSGYQAGMAVARAIKTGGDAVNLYYDQTQDIRDHIGECNKHQQMFPVSFLSADGQPCG